MRITGLLILVTAVGAMLVGAVPAVAAASKCRPKGSKVVMRSASVLVVARRGSRQQACYLPTRRVRVLDNPVSSEDTPTAESIARVYQVNDRYVAYALIGSDRGGSTMSMRVLDARRGRVVTDVGAYAGSLAPSTNLAPGFTDVELRRNGAVAWISTHPEPDPVKELRFARRRQRDATVVASSAAIEAGSLALGRRYVYWRQAGVAMSAAA
jgi:hypothetical protein